MDTSKFVCLVKIIFLLYNVPDSASNTINEIELSTTCIGNDSFCVHEHKTRTLRNNDGGIDAYVDETIRLPLSALIEVVADISKACIVNIDKDIARGRHVVERPGASYQGRLDIRWDIVPTSQEFGNLVLHMVLRNLEYGDYRELHLEARTDEVLFKTKGKLWFPDLKTLEASTSALDVSTEFIQIDLQKSHNQTIRGRESNMSNANEETVIIIHDKVGKIGFSLVIIIGLLMIGAFFIKFILKGRHQFEHYKQASNKLINDARWHGKTLEFYTWDFQGTDSNRQMEPLVHECVTQFFSVPSEYQLEGFTKEQGGKLYFKLEPIPSK